ncbi:hypothetical protein [Pseudobacteriovorax antillogorgiicola]|uniref:Uncharacterized protein n=1 Tax=Pseudobacteriovorax antillogorgiicola TaxID=1513793 RepID=A0A1Y6B8T3_9BACT|nr:hypothetical protein [Pseudobacteriovorax antillogorgiicola]TCS59511.1 hypothetical protein EDD56_101431 [Pseudobacteriovorax antillogorgiicola]SME87880.1 hypothetical protein SAMN06296036_10154 [Pseudobacteriovorax antillogorgiicola]
MRFLFLASLLTLSSQGFAVEKLDHKKHNVETAFTHSTLYDKAASDLRVRQLQKLVHDETWTRKQTQARKSAKKQ